VERPSADEYMEAFDGRFYGPTSPPAIGWMHSDWGAYDGEPSSLGLVTSLAVGKQHESLVVRNSLSPESTTGIVHQLLFRDPTRPFRFPLLVEKGRARIPVDGRERVFTAYSHRGHTVAAADVRGVAITVTCRSRVLPAVRLARLELEQLRQMMRDADEFGRTVGGRRRQSN
jgi:hypothetical protein